MPRDFRRSAALYRGRRRLQRAKAENVRGYGLRSVHVSCLLALYEHEEGLTGTELAAVCGVDRAQISRGGGADGHGAHLPRGRAGAAAALSRRAGR